MIIRTDNKFRNLLYWYELTKKEKEYFDYLDTEEKQDSASFVRYKKQVYSIDEFMRIENHPNKEFSKWDGYSSDSFFSGILIKFDEYCEQVKMGTYIS
jgi:hypothetical protein